MPWLWQIALSFLLSSGAQNEALEQFPQIYKSITADNQKIEAILALDGFDNPQLVALLLPALQDANLLLRHAAIEVLSKLQTPEAQTALLNAVAKSQGFAKASLLLALKNCANAKVLNSLQEALTDSSSDVRIAATKVLGHCQNLTDISSLIENLAHKNRDIRIATCKTLGQINATNSIPVIGELLAQKDWKLRTAAMQALGMIRDKACIPILIGQMQHEAGRLLDDAAHSLLLLTGLQLGPNYHAWQQWWNSVQANYRLPTMEELASFAKQQREGTKDYKMAAAELPQAITSSSKQILFVLDISGSMEEGVPNQPNKLAKMRAKIIAMIAELDKDSAFNIMLFAKEWQTWQSELVSAGDYQKIQAKAYIEKLSALGGRSQPELAASGFVQGRTDLQATIEQMLRTEADTIVFCSDGIPSTGTLTPEDLLLLVSEKNYLEQIVIHTIHVGLAPSDFMQKLAQQNNGQSIQLNN